MLPKTPKPHEAPRALLGLRSQPATLPRSAPFSPQQIALWILSAIVLYAAWLVFLPLAAPIVLGAWAAHLSRPLFLRVSRVLHGRQTAAALFTTVLLLLIIAPFALGATTL